MSNKHKWYTVTDKVLCSIDFSLSENTNEKDEPLELLPLKDIKIGGIK